MVIAKIKIGILPKGNRNGRPAHKADKKLKSIFEHAAHIATKTLVAGKAPAITMMWS
jgi:hypothetical protein